MTSNEAITLLRNLEDKLGSYCELNEEEKTTFRMAIEALNRSEFPNNSGCISRQTAIDALDEIRHVLDKKEKELIILPSAPPEQPEPTRTFAELVVEYPNPELCTYKEYRGKPYYSIKYIENGERYIGYGTYNPEVLSQYLKEYFISSAQQNRLERAVAGKSPEEIYEFLYWLMFDYARAYTDSRAAVIAWLKGEYE